MTTNTHETIVNVPMTHPTVSEMLDMLVRFHNTNNCDGEHAPEIKDCDCDVARLAKKLQYAREVYSR